MSGPRKYVQPGKEPIRVYFPPSMHGKKYNDVDAPLILTEGEFKALSADSHDGAEK